MKPLLAIVALGVVAGCRKSDPPPAPPVLDNAPAATSAAPQGGGSGGVQIGPGNLGGATPVTGTESLQGGGGSAAGSILKDRARNLGGGASSLDQLGGE